MVECGRRRCENCPRIFSRYDSMANCKDIARILQGYCKDILKERARLGGDWAVAGVLFTPKLRQIVRFGKRLNVDNNTYVKGGTGTAG